MIRIIQIPHWFPEFIKKWIFKSGENGDCVIPKGSTLILQKDMRFAKLVVEEGGVLITNGFRIYTNQLLQVDGIIKNQI